MLHRRPPRRPPLPTVLAAVLVALALATTAIGLAQRPTETPVASGLHESGGGSVKQERKKRAARSVSAVPVARTAGSEWTGYAFDACRAPSQRVMDRWLKKSPFVGVGIYLGGVHRACEQEHLTPRWIHRQVSSGWRLLPLWVGPQAACTGYDHRIDPRPGAERRYLSARADGARNALGAAHVARQLGIAPGELIFFDIEPFPTDRRDCTGSALAFLEAWTKELHRQGYRSGVYSHVNAGIKLLARTGAGYTRPDAVWYAWIDRANRRPTEYVSDPGFMKSHRVHQFVLDQRVRFGGIAMDIDWNYVSFGEATGEMPLLKLGAKGEAVRRLQERLNAVLANDVEVDGSFGRATAQAVKRYHKRVGHARTSVVTARTWQALGQAPVAAAATEPAEGAKKAGKKKAGAKRHGATGKHGKPGKNAKDGKRGTKADGSKKATKAKKAKGTKSGKHRKKGHRKGKR